MIKLGDNMIVNSKKMLSDAKKGSYAIPHFNINNLEWTRFILEACEEQQIPVILGVSEGAANYMGGFYTVASLVKALVQDLKITIPVCLHLDHGKSVEACKNAIDAGFTSVMIDASSLSVEENVRLTKEVVDYAHARDVSVEAEMGRVGGSEDGVEGKKYHAKIEDCVRLYEETGIDSIAPALGSVHGLYKGKPNLDFVTMQKMNEILPIPLVLHGGTGIPEEDLKKAISCGIAKINVNTELQIVWTKAVRAFLSEDQTEYDPRRIIRSGEVPMKEQIHEFIKIFGTRS